MKSLARFVEGRIKARGSTVLILALISIVGFVASAFDVFLSWGLGIYSAIIAQFLLGLSLYIESDPKRLWHPWAGIKLENNFGKLAIYLLSLVVMLTALVRFPFLSLIGLDFIAQLETVKSMIFFSNILGAVAIFYETFIVR